MCRHCKASGVYPKNPAQHASDIEMLEQQPEIAPAFIDLTTNQRKLVECVRVDGASDEGPAHEEVQFFWTARHLEKEYIATIVSARNSGASYLNRIELQNGCLALGHANVFIPSTLVGSNIDSNTAKLDKETFTRNMELATDVYINRVNHSPFGETVIQLYRGSDSKQKQEIRESLLIFLKGSKRDKVKLKNDNRELYDYFEMVWDLKNRHLLPHHPVQYLFCLVCCFQQGCCHPICRKREPIELPRWFEGGSPVSYIPIPIPDSTKPWGASDCPDCCGVLCKGHYLKPTEALQLQHASAMFQPPSVMLKEEFLKLNGASPSVEFVENAAKKVLLSTSEVSFWFDHLKTVSDNRKRGAAKAAGTRIKRKATKESLTYCGVCNELYVEFTDQVQNWISCESCSTWYHFVCVGIVDEPGKFICENCLN